ncbi:hypothetical protein GXM_09732 [Nostoc sphaeroides CCNUC1]|uniref:Uncharacterized protein n=1 Tax=Nostoc sphaeroides CCNUC1 TaxID=2653204 RepID=A0A5P8WHH5_9NOSO|nr:hypothetical protein GXM_09732 [Nostoc sphaeroides CCNUC1]
MRFLDCNKPARRIIFECYHCQQGAFYKFMGEPVVGEYNGRPSSSKLRLITPTVSKRRLN